MKKASDFSLKRSFHQVIDMTSCHTNQSVIVLLISNRPRVALLSHTVQFEITRARLFSDYSTWSSYYYELQLIVIQMEGNRMHGINCETSNIFTASPTL